MGKYDWLLKTKGTWAYNYDYFSEGIIGYRVIHEGPLIENGEMKGIKISWAYSDRGQEFKYSGTSTIRERNLYATSNRTDENEQVLTVFPLPSNYKFDALWGISVGTTGGFPCAFHVLWTTRKLTIEQAKIEFKHIGANRENAMIAMDYDPDKFKPAFMADKKKTGSNVIEIDQPAYENTFLNSLKEDMETP